MNIAFHGAAQTVTGSKHLITMEDGRTILLDCGMFQGHGVDADQLNRHWGFEPKKVDFMVLSHAHIDHSGLIPKLVKDGFRGKIFATPATYDLCEILLTDSCFIQEADINFLNKKRKKQGKPLLEPMYSMEDVQTALAKFRLVNYNKPFEIDKGVELIFTDAGHILGSAAVHLNIHDFSKYYKITFTGDIGRYNNKILRSPERFRQADYIICESTYGDILHEETGFSETRLLKIVQETCVQKRGKLIIPAFSVGRTQEIVNMLNNLEFEGKLPRIKVYVDSPLSTDATEIYRKHKDCFNDDVKKYIEQDPTPFGFNKLTYITDVEESKQLNFSDEPCIIISASGMADAGRVKHHIANNVTDRKNTILIVGWCSPNSLGRKLLRGDKEVRIFGESHKVEAEVIVMNEFSAHGDYNEMLRFLSCQNAAQVKQVFTVHGDEEVLTQWKPKLKSAGFRNVVSPTQNEKFDLQ